MHNNIKCIYTKMPTRLTILIILLLQLLCSSTINTEVTKYPNNFKLPDLPYEHLKRYLNTFTELKAYCQQSANHCQLPENVSLSVVDGRSTACWGHEVGCSATDRFQTPICPGDHTGWVRSKSAQVETFYYQTDFGYIKQQIEELSVMCEPKYFTDSSLECTKYLRFCRGRNLMFDFRDLIHRKEMIRYNMDVLRLGQLVGHCSLNRTRLKVEMDHMSALQSWAPELRNFDELPMPLLTGDNCDMTVNTPTFIMKIDSTFNMYHHFCDFFNLYVSLFVNQTHTSAFVTNTQIIIWETYPYESPFAETFKAFTKKPVWTLNDIKGKRVCFRNVVLPLLPRMIFGLFYNTPIIQGCQNSGLFRAFSEFVLHRLQIPFQPPLKRKKVRITFLSRLTTYRQVLNEADLLEELRGDEDYVVRRVSFERAIGFKDQLAITRNTDVLIGMHGAGLTHLLFLPNWATIFELHNCEDPNCYKDLARLRGVNYITWQDRELAYPQDEGHHPQGGAHAKFTNYSFDRTEFARLVALAAKHVRSHPEYQKYQETVPDDVSMDKDEL
ncbi:EGF domain-specific O-linked N-acetylglucosamine transferase [Teleopsis dalmanni]|uniref:EGF domain-specific O-linked N-acetylglucosamine transferase n=1 Tax=Teleopsis dalmanni TaxID=139649 RepID=UPI0018CFA649|nr:EGF domain-specific O-linked N-acetylglucosamine transferase [Teleopsis dalmanni]